jgi:hypothetical protein
MSGFEAPAAEVLLEAGAFDMGVGGVGEAMGLAGAGAGTAAGIASLTGFGDGTAMGMIPEASAVPGISSLTPTLQAANPAAYDQIVNAFKDAGVGNNPLMNGAAVNVAGGAGTNAAAFDALNAAEGANYGGSGFSQFPGAGTESASSLTRSLGAGTPLSEAAAYQAVGQPTSMAEMAQTASKYGPLGANAESAGFGWDKIAGAYNAIPKELRYAGMGYGALQALNADKNKYGTPPQEKYSGPLSKFQYDPSRYTPTTTPQPTPYTPTRYSYAEGGIASLGGYSDGGRMLKGPGDGMSDSIPATISNKQPARLADGEFVVPADVVSHLGNGSTDAGAKQLYKMMDKVRVARTGKSMQGRQINPRKYVPA